MGKTFKIIQKERHKPLHTQIYKFVDKIVNHLFILTENKKGEKTAPKLTVNPIDMTMKNQSVSSLEASGGEARLQIRGICLAIISQRRSVQTFVTFIRS